jgi:ATP-dependent phosphofructokinase / diphosphate-dependent phosphofructokinase
MSSSKPTIGILTGGGDCPGLNAVIRAATKSAVRLGYDMIGFLRGYEGLVDPVSYMPLDARLTADILLKGGTILGSSNKGRFTALVGAGERVRIDPALLDQAAHTVRQLGVVGLICVGGDGSLAIAQQLHEHGIPVVGVPKTIDNDLGATAFTFGFDSAVATATDALDRLHTTAASHERVMVLEVMGRHAGWIALHAGIAGGGDVILLPEIPWSFENVCQKILDREAGGKRFTLVVAAEGACLPGGGLVHGRHESGEQRQVRLGGIGGIVADEIAARLGRDVRAVVLGHLQRGGTPTAFDRMLATEFGAHAVRLVHEGRFGETVCYRPPEIESAPIADAIRNLSTVNPRGSAVQAARALGIGFGDDADRCDPFRGCRPEADGGALPDGR